MVCEFKIVKLSNQIYLYPPPTYSNSNPLGPQMLLKSITIFSKVTYTFYSVNYSIDYYYYSIFHQILFLTS